MFKSGAISFAAPARALAALFLAGAVRAAAAPPAFPGAEGYGANAVGGRGGAVIHVSNLNDSGAGSFREALLTAGPRTIVFDVGGTIDLQSPIRCSGAAYGNVTIAGQTAPGGVALHGAAIWFVNCAHVVIRHLALRGVHNCTPGTDSGQDMLTFYGPVSPVHDVIVDHVSAACGEDETISGNRAYNVTMQWCALEQACVRPQGGTYHPEPGHNYGSLWGYYDTGGFSIHHNFFGNMYKRNPEVDAGEFADIRNNVVYNWQDVGVNMAKRGSVYPAAQEANIVGNSYLEGPLGVNRKHIVTFSDATTATVYFAQNKYVSHGGTAIADNDTLWNDSLMVLGKHAGIARAGNALEMAPVTTHTAEEAFALVLNTAGAFPHDVIRRQLVEQLLTKTSGARGAQGPLERLPCNPNGATRAATDTDRDGMPDAWEIAHGLNPADAADRNDVVGAGQSTGDRHKDYTWLEYYINEVADSLVPSPVATHTIAAGATTLNGGAAHGVVVSTVGGWTANWNRTNYPVLTPWGDRQVFNDGSLVSLRAHASTNLTVTDAGQTPLAVMSAFEHWAGGPAGVDGSTNPVVSFVADADYAIQAVFDEGPAITVTKLQDAVEDGQAGRFRIARSGTSGNLTVAYTAGGTAAAGADYAALSGSATIPDGSAYTDVDIAPISDGTAESTKYVDIALTDTLSIEAAPAPARVYLFDDDVPDGQTVYFNKGDNTGRNWNSVEGWVQTANPANAYNMVPRGSDSAYVGTVRIDGVEAAAWAGFLAVGWRDASANMDTGALTIEGANAAHQRLSVATDLRLSDGISGGNAGSVTQNNGLVTIGDDLVMSYTAVAGAYALQAGTLEIADDFEIGPADAAGGQGGATAGDVAFTLNGGAVTIGGDLWANRGNAAVRKIEVFGGTLSVASNASIGGNLQLDVNNGTVSIGGMADLAIDSSRTNTTINVRGGTLTIGGLLDMNNPGQAQVNVSGGVLQAGDLAIKTAANNKLNLAGGGVVRVLQANYTLAEADADIAAGDIAGAGLVVSTIAIGGADYTQIACTGGEVVSVTATDALATEAGPTTGQFTLTRVMSTSGALTVDYTLSGTASNGVDYAALSGSVTIPDGQSSVTVTVTPLDDTLQEPDEAAILTVVNGSGYIAGGPASATVTLVSDDAPNVNVTADVPTATEAGPAAGRFTVSRGAVTSGELTVNYAVSGTAGNGTDYSRLGGQAVIRDGLSSVSLPVIPADDALVENDETVVVTLTPGSGYLVGAAGSATVTIVSDDLPIVSVTASDAYATETYQQTGAFAVSRGALTSGDLTVHYAMGGTASNGADYAALPGSVTIPNGQSNVTLTVTPVQDAEPEGDETVILALAPRAAYLLTVGTVSAAVVIADDDILPTVSVVASDAAAAENPADAGMFTIDRNGRIDGDLIVNYAMGGTASNGVDYAALSGSAVIPDGQSATTVTIAPLDDSLAEGTEWATLTLAGSASYAIGPAASATVTIRDDDAVPARVVWNRNQADASWNALHWNDAYSETNRVPLSCDEVLVGDVTCDTRAAGANSAEAVAGSLQIGWRPVGQSAHWDSGVLAVYGDAGDSSLTVTGTLYLANGQNQNGTLRQEGGVIAVGGDVRMSSGYNFGTWTNDMNGGVLEIGGHLLLSEMGTDATPFFNSTTSPGVFDQAGGSRVTVAGDVRINRGYQSTRTYAVHDGAALAVGGSLQVGGCFAMTSEGAVTVAGNVELGKDSTRTNSVLRIAGGSFAIGGSLDMNEPGTGQVEISGGVLTVGDLDIRSAADNRLVISGGGVLLARQAAYSLADAAADIAAGRIAKESGMTVGAVSVGGVSYTRIGRQASQPTVILLR